MTDAPERIYLQWIPEGHPAAEYDEITWCIHEINDEDIRYIRTDIADKRIAELNKRIDLLNAEYGYLLSEKIET
jgi:hypothetical protein